MRCPGLDCNTRVKLTALVNHVVPCCVERSEIRTYKLPHKFSYMMNEDLKNLSGESQNFNWKLEGVKFDNKVFFLKVTRKARTGRWFFYVQIVGSDSEANGYTADITVFRPDIGPAGKYSQRSGMFGSDSSSIQFGALRHYLVQVQHLTFNLV